MEFDHFSLNEMVKESHDFHETWKQKIYASGTKESNSLSKVSK